MSPRGSSVDVQPRALRAQGAAAGRLSGNPNTKVI
jgi:hypothetical protein